MTWLSITAEKIRRNAAWKFSTIIPCNKSSMDLTNEIILASGTTTESGSPSLLLPYKFISISQFKSLTKWADDIPVTHKKGDMNDVNLLFPAYYGLILMNAYSQNGNQKSLDEGIKMLQYLEDNGRSNGSGIRLEYNTEIPKFHLGAPWISGLTQSLAILLALRLHSITQNPAYLEVAARFAVPMMHAVKEGGTLCETPEGHPWLEEYPGTRHSYVLNGFLFSLIAILEGEQKGLKFEFDGNLWQEGLIASMSHYTCGKYVRYDRLTGKFCSPHYMGLQTLLFEHLFQITGNEAYRLLAQRFSRHTNWSLYFDSVGLQPSSSDWSWLDKQFG